jgi:hypothetical protein
MKRACLLFAFLLGCGDSAASGGSAGDHTGSGSSTTPGEGGDPPRGLVVRGLVNANGEVSPIVEAHEDEQLTVQKRIVVETETDGTFRAVDVRGLTLRASCDAPEVDCIELARGGGLRPPPWNARSGIGQCVPVNEGRAVPAGVYRFVVTTCEGGHRVESEPFRIAR